MTRAYLACIYYAVFVCILYKTCWHAYDTQFSHTYDMHLPHNPNPTHRVVYTRQSPFLRVNTMSFHFYLAYYLYVHEIVIGNLILRGHY